ncbi:transposase [Actinoplanes sp. N902-109]|nr:transposase [Actinoplanes sp. N902-109]
MEGSGGYGAGLARHLAGNGEWVVELDRPQRPARRGGAKSDPIDAERAARDALARTRLAQPRTGVQRAALQMRLTARRAAVAAGADAQQQLHAMVTTAPETVRARFRYQSTRIILITASRLRPAGVQDVEVFTCLSVLGELARRVRFLEAQARAHEKAIIAVVKAWRPDLLEHWSRADRRRDRPDRLVTTRPLPHRRRVRHAGGHCTDSCLVRQDRPCLKRYVARELFRRLETTPPHLDES